VKTNLENIFYSAIFDDPLSRMGRVQMQKPLNAIWNFLL